MATPTLTSIRATISYWTHRVEGIAASALSAALAEHLGDGAVVIGWSPTHVTIGTTRADGLVDTTGSAIDTSRWFGMRAFNQKADVSWTADHGSGGRLTFVAESALADGEEHVVDGRIDGVQYLVLGEGDLHNNGWLTLSSGAVGSLSVPFHRFAQRVAIQAVEYVRFDDDGNADVVHERLVGLIEMGAR